MLHEDFLQSPLRHGLWWSSSFSSKLARHVKLAIVVVCQDIVQFSLNRLKGLEGLFKTLWLCVVYDHVFFDECPVTY